MGKLLQINTFASATESLELILGFQVYCFDFDICNGSARGDMGRPKELLVAISLYMAGRMTP
ncbi:hypothetical protein CCACVL1_30478 [Corchorus capsularis]|uniref:Uncharacterized protein n=1 Tax=Corchorus capsularis TaxID=210143 RepID=A0A1R3FX03_COCAP|nr:hypothetical protein CCACVL1_30478 [Corchorus capsularis]